MFSFSEKQFLVENQKMNLIFAFPSGGHCHWSSDHQTTCNRPYTYASDPTRKIAIFHLLSIITIVFINLLTKTSGHFVSSFDSDILVFQISKNLNEKSGKVHRMCPHYVFTWSLLDFFNFFSCQPQKSSGMSRLFTSCSPGCRLKLKGDLMGRHFDLANKRFWFEGKIFDWDAFAFHLNDAIFSPPNTCDHLKLTD